MKVQSDREIAMNEIVASRKEQLTQEAAAEPGPVIEAELEAAPVKDETEPAQAEAEATESAGTPSEPPAEAAAPKLVKAKVDDVEYDVPQEEIDKSGSVALWQMEKAMQNRLKDLNEQKTKMAAYLKQLEQPIQPPPNPDAELESELETLRYGEPDKAKKILAQLKAANVPQDQIVDAAVKRIKWDNAVEQFMAENGDLLKDPDVQLIAVARENQLKQAMQQTKQWPQDIAKFYKDLGAQLRSKYGKPATVDLEKRIEAKEALAEPKAASGRVPQPPTQKPKSVAEIINEQRKARGQAVH